MKKNEQFGYLESDTLKSDASMLEDMRSQLDERDHLSWLILSKISILLYGCYEFGINPLPTLRKVFPEYDWKYIDLTGKSDKGYKQALTHIAITSDFFWHAVKNGEGEHWVTAKKRGGSKQTPIFGSGRIHNQTVEISDLLRVLGVRDLYPTDSNE